MQPAGGGGNGLSRAGGAGLARYRSAPATWLEALLENDDDDDIVLDTPVLAPSSNKPPLHPPSSSAQSTQQQPNSVENNNSRYAADLGLLDSVGNGGGGLSGLLRQNSSPAELLSDGYFSSFEIPANYDFLMGSSPVNVSSESPSKRPRESDSDNPSPKASSQVKGEQSEQLQAGLGALLDAEMEKLSEDAVLCRVRAKRGCATHPRSIAERVRRTRISDRIRKLQELVPNMDKQTNTADMLEEAVEYVKFLQKQIQELTEQQKKCKCFAKE
ncbi:hypothetical protein ACH5RR_026133 [Cinchona calisaya]|uniref:BHLH domain-containing protein n=1 Tax=Cinchona calisaya TaxID=153742 RepID=A0ABD2Z3K7_9GENT